LVLLNVLKPISFKTKKNYIPPTALICVLYGPKKQRFFPSETLTDLFLQSRSNMFTVRQELLLSTQFSLIFTFKPSKATLSSFMH